MRASTHVAIAFWVVLLAWSPTVAQESELLDPSAIVGTAIRAEANAAGTTRVSIERVLTGTSSSAGDTVRLVVDGPRKPDRHIQNGRRYVFLVEPLGQRRFRLLFALTPQRPNQSSSCPHELPVPRDSSGKWIWLTTPQWTSLASRTVPMQTPGLMDGHMKGNVTLLLSVGTDGKPECIQILRSHPLASASAIEALRQWTFHPFLIAGKPSPVSGEITLSYEFGGQK